MNKRIGLLLTLAGVMAAVLTLSAVGASAEPQCTVTKTAKRTYTQVCVETSSFGQAVTDPSATQPCETADGRTGTQEGILFEESRITTTTTTTTVFNGKPKKGNIISGPTAESVVTTELINRTFTPTGECVVV
jgi:hypothetical protein